MTKLPRTNFDKVIDGVITMIVPGVAALMIKKLFRNNRV